MPDINVWQISWHHLISTFNISNIFEIFFYGPKDFVSGKLWPHSGVRGKVTGSPMLLRNTQCISSKFSGILLSGIQIVQWVSVGAQPALLWLWQFLEYSEHNTACLIYKSKKIFFLNMSPTSLSHPSVRTYAPDHQEEGSPHSYS